MLNTINREKIETMFKAFINKEQLNLDPLLNQWTENKRDIFELFGNSLTLEKPFSGTLTDDEIRKEFRNFWGNNDHYTSYKADEFASELTAEEIKNNKCLEDRLNYPKYIKNQKLSKYIMTLFGDESSFIEINGKTKSKYEYFQIQFSMFLQSLKFEGIIVVSIDPLDYLTMSLNKNNWKSCHRPTGEYRGGMLSYMTDSCSVINYVKSVNDVEYEYDNYTFTHNSKKWRQVGYIDINTLSAIFSRQYPADNETSARAARELIGEQYSNFLGIENKYSITRNGKRIRAMVKDKMSNPLHYNDILCMDREYTRLKMAEGGQNPNIEIGNDPYCPECGEKFLNTSGRLTCNRCRSRKYTCPDCGKIICPDDGDKYLVIDGDVYCKSCGETNFIHCEDCEEYKRKDKITNLDGKLICDRCLSRHYNKCHECGKLVKDNLIIDYNRYNYCITCYDAIVIEEVAV